jgi:hypothetical protein
MRRCASPMLRYAAIGGGGAGWGLGFSRPATFDPLVSGGVFGIFLKGGRDQQSGPSGEKSMLQTGVTGWVNLILYNYIRATHSMNFHEFS